MVVEAKQNNLQASMAQACQYVTSGRDDVHRKGTRRAGRGQQGPKLGADSEQDFERGWN